ncbi:MAG: hypothetical protein ACI915_003811 [Gammaproteobacteria bacterium]|jgi:hypothetical protein
MTTADLGAKRCRAPERSQEALLGASFSMIRWSGETTIRWRRPLITKQFAIACFPVYSLSVAVKLAIIARGLVSLENLRGQQC